MSAQTIPEDVFAGIELLGHGDRAELERKLADQSLHILWGTATTNRPHIGYLIPLLSLVKLLNKGARVTILLADIHACLDNQRSSWETLESRSKYYQALLVNTLKSLDAPMDRVKFVRGSDFQLSREYMLDVHRLASLVTEDEATKAGVDVVAQVKHPTVGGLLYPILHALDEEFLKADVQFGGTDQRALFEFSEKYLPILSYSKRIHMMHALLPGLTGGVMRSSDDDSKIDLLDSAKVVKNKIAKKAFCAEGECTDNSVLDLAKSVIFPICHRLDINRPEKFGGPLSYKDYAQLETDFAEKKLHPGDLKSGVESHLNALLDKIRTAFDNPELIGLSEDAYPAKPNKKSSSKRTKSGSISMSPCANEHSYDIGDMDKEERVKLIVRYLQEVIGQERLESLVEERNLSIYWGTATTGKPHIGYFVPMMKIADFVKAGCDVTILLADLHGYLDNQKAPWELLDARTKYYDADIKSMLKSLDIPMSKIKFIRGSDYELSKEFNTDVYRLVSITSIRDAKKAGAEVVKQVMHATIGSILYPLLQALDEEYLHVDAQFGGVDQRKIFTFAEKYLPALGYAKRIHLMNPMIPGLAGSKMSSSDLDSKVDSRDSSEDITRKLMKALNEPDNGVLAFVKNVILPLFGHLEVPRPNGSEALKYDVYERLEEDCQQKIVENEELVKAINTRLDQLLNPIRKDFEDSNLIELTSRAYP